MLLNREQYIPTGMYTYHSQEHNQEHNAAMSFNNEREQLYLETDALDVGLGASLL